MWWSHPSQDTGHSSFTLPATAAALPRLPLAVAPRGDFPGSVRIFVPMRPCRPAELCLEPGPHRCPGDLGLRHPKSPQHLWFVFPGQLGAGPTVPPVPAWPRRVTASPVPTHPRSFCVSAGPQGAREGERRPSPLPPPGHCEWVHVTTWPPGFHTLPVPRPCRVPSHLKHLARWSSRAAAF